MEDGGRDSQFRVFIEAADETTPTLGNEGDSAAGEFTGVVVVERAVRQLVQLGSIHGHFEQVPRRVGRPSPAVLHGAAVREVERLAVVRELGRHETAVVQLAEGK